MTALLTLPAFYSPFPLETHPDEEAVEQDTITWMDRYGLYADKRQRQRLVRTGCGRLAALMAPRGTQERVQVLADFTTWAFAFDDEYCDESPLGTRPGELADALCRLQRAMESPEHPVDPANHYAMALCDVRARLEACTSPAHAEAFVEWMRSYFLIEVQKAGNSSRGLRPGLSDYAVTRLYSGGGMVLIRLPAVVAGISAPLVFTDRRLRALTEMAATITNWDTDFFSLAKERERTGDGYNLIDAVMTEHGCDQQIAVDLAMGLRDRVMSLFLRLHEDVAESSSPGVVAYLGSLTRYMRGVLEWTQHTHRYVHLDGIAGACPFEGGGLTTEPRVTPDEPPDIPSIAWWWYHDPRREQR